MANKKIIAALSGMLVCAVLCTCLVNRLDVIAQPAMISTADLPTVIIDAGHGGFDGGAVSGKTVEKDINLAISLYLRDMLTSSGFNVIMIREEDISVHDPSANTVRKKKNTDLNNRLKIINKSKDALFVSIHQNMYSDGRYSGAQVFYSPNDPGSKGLALIMQNTIIDLLQNDNTRQIKQATKALFLLYNAEIPAIMVECGFMSNASELALLKSSDYQRKMSFAVMCGILRYCGEK